MKKNDVYFEFDVSYSSDFVVIYQLSNGGHLSNVGNFVKDGVLYLLKHPYSYTDWSYAELHKDDGLVFANITQFGRNEVAKMFYENDMRLKDIETYSKLRDNQ